MLRYDVVGCGEVVALEHAPVLRRLRADGLLTIRVCVDASFDRAERMAKLMHARPAASVSDAGISDADAALIATPPEAHVELALAYLSAGKSVLVEKPFAPTQCDAEKLLAAARVSNARVLVGHMRRLYPSIRVAREVVRSGVLGEIRAAEAREGGRWDWGVTSRYVVSSAFGGVLYDTGSHVLDTLLFVLGLDDLDAAPTVAVDSVVRDRRSEPSHDIHALFRLCSGGRDLPVEFHVSRTSALPRCVLLHGEHASLVVGGAYAQQPTLIAGKRAIRVDLQLNIPRPMNPSGCFRLEHEAMAKPAKRSEINEILDGARFVALAGLLEILTCS